MLLQATFFFSFFINIFGPCALKTLANTFVWLALASNLSFAKALPVHHKFTNKFMETETVNVALGLLRKGIGDIAFRCRRLSFAFHLINLRNLSESFWMCSSFFLEAKPWLLPWRSPEATKKWLKTNSGMLAGKFYVLPAKWSCKGRIMSSLIRNLLHLPRWETHCYVNFHSLLWKLWFLEFDAKKAGNNAKRLSLCHFKGFKLQTLHRFTARKNLIFCFQHWLSASNRPGLQYLERNETGNGNWDLFGKSLEMVLMAFMCFWVPSYHCLFNQTKCRSPRWTEL